MLETSNPCCLPIPSACTFQWVCWHVCSGTSRLDWDSFASSWRGSQWRSTATTTWLKNCMGICSVRRSQASKNIQSSTKCLWIWDSEKYAPSCFDTKQADKENQTIERQLGRPIDRSKDEDRQWGSLKTERETKAWSREDISNKSQTDRADSWEDQHAHQDSMKSR